MNKRETRFGKKLEKNIRYNEKTDTYFVQFTFKDLSQLKSFATLEEARHYRDSINWAKTEAKIRHDIMLIHQREEEEIKRRLEKMLAYPDNVLSAIGVDLNDYRIPENFDTVFEKCNDKERMCVQFFYRDRMTLAKIGIEFGITRQRVNQIVAAGLKKIKSYIFSYEKRERTKMLELDLADRHAMREKLIEAYRETGVITDEMNFEFGKLYTNPKNGLVEEYDIEELDLSIRAYRCLKRAKINTLGQLIEKTEDDLRRLKNMGTKSIREIEEKLANVGLSLAVEED